MRHISYALAHPKCFVVCRQEELVPPRAGSVSQRAGRVQPAVQRGDQLGDDQDDLQCERSGALYVAKSIQSPQKNCATF